MYKKVPGERLVAAIIDSVIVGIISFIPAGIYFASIGFDSLIESIMMPSAIGGVEGLSATFQIVTMLSGLIVGVIYFVVIPRKYNGQTLGKKIMNIKAIDEFGNNPTFKNHFLRALQNWGVYTGSIALLLLLINTTVYSIVIVIVSGGVNILTFVSYIMILAQAEGRGLHDLIAGTYVVHAEIDTDKQFIEKTTQMGDWAEVDYQDNTKAPEEKEKDNWYD